MLFRRPPFLKSFETAPPNDRRGDAALLLFVVNRLVSDDWFRDVLFGAPRQSVMRPRILKSFALLNDVDQHIDHVVIGHVHNLFQPGYSLVRLFRYRKSLIHFCGRPFASNLSTVYYGFPFMSMTFIDIPEIIRYDIDCSESLAFTSIDISVNRLTRYFENVGK